MAPSIAEKRKTAGARCSLIAKEVLVIVSVWWLIEAYSISASSVGLSLAGWRVGTAFGLGGAGLLVGLRRLGRHLLPGRTQTGHDEEVQGGGYLYWSAVVVLPPLAEELWRAFCLFGLMSVWGSALLAVGATSLAFGLGHLTRGPGAALAVAAVGAALAVLYVSTASLVAPLLVHAALNLDGLLNVLKERVAITSRFL